MDDTTIRLICVICDALVMLGPTIAVAARTMQDAMANLPADTRAWLASFNPHSRDGFKP